MEVISEIGRGGQGVVDLVLIDGKEYAWKHGGKLSMMEVDIMFRIRSPYIVSGVNISYEPEGIIMTYLPYSFETYLGQKNFVLINQALVGLYHLHLSNIIHFDIKPDNICVDRENVVKLIDFGYAVKVENNKDELRMLPKGTVLYASPVMAEGILSNGKEVRGSYKDDVYSMGLVLYFMLYGEDEIKEIENDFVSEKIDTKGVLQRLIMLREKILSLPVSSSLEGKYLEAIKKMISYDGSTMKDILNFLSIDGEESNLISYTPSIPNISDQLEFHLINEINKKLLPRFKKERELVISLFKRGYLYAIENNIDESYLLRMCFYICYRYYGLNLTPSGNFDRKVMIRFIRKQLNGIIFT